MAGNMIEDLRLSPRITNALHRAGIHTIQDLLVKHEDIQSIKGLGQKGRDKLLKIINSDKTGKENSLSLFYNKLSDILCPIISINWINLSDLVKEHGLQEIIENKEEQITSSQLLALFSIPKFNNAVNKYFKEIISKKHSITPNEFELILKKAGSNELSQALLDVFHSNTFTVVLRENVLLKTEDKSILDIINQIEKTEKKSREQHIFLSRLSGNTLQKIGDKYRLTRERVRQIAKEEAQKCPKLLEDNYRDIFMYFNIGKDEFLCAFPELSPEAYEYLRLRYKKGTYPFDTYYADKYNGIFCHYLNDYLAKKE